MYITLFWLEYYLLSIKYVKKVAILFGTNKIILDGFIGIEKIFKKLCIYFNVFI